ncbi:helix-turn-helix domain-containing protein [Aliagarivorans taiwanensis]|uniref:helix-turn-helix domain-containing protein n=1 Tax=Aliagarivorans taiwanensis TaxID=561966 RepID=UPI00041F073B|nr:AraC family transcriptional regulator [Aliagarivorans taiwanensis]
MKDHFLELMDGALNELHGNSRVCFASDQSPPPPASYQVNFPRLELVFSGNYESQISDQQSEPLSLTRGDALYIPANAWNKPDWRHECSVLSLLFGKQHLGLSLVSKPAVEQTSFDVVKFSVNLGREQTLDYLTMAMTSIGHSVHSEQVAKDLVRCIVGSCCDLLKHTEAQPEKRSQRLFRTICIYVQQHFHETISRDSVAEHFNISANHLSRLFRKEGYMRFADYVAWVRLERAKFLLRRYNFRLDEIALRCGYRDTNYFCRVFKNKTGLTPSEYRR